MESKTAKRLDTIERVDLNINRKKRHKEVLLRATTKQVPTW